MIDRPDSPLSVDGATAEMNEVSKEFHRSLSISNNDAVIAKSAGQDDKGVGVQSSNCANGGTKNASSSSDSPEDVPNKEVESQSDRKFIAPKDFELLKVIGMGECATWVSVYPKLSTLMCPFPLPTFVVAVKGPLARSCKCGTVIPRGYLQ